MKLHSSAASALLSIVASATLAFAQDGGAAGMPAGGTSERVAPVEAQTTETPFVGTYTASGGVKGTLVVARKGDELILGLDHEQGCTETRSSELGAGPWRIPLPGRSRGIASRVAGEEKPDAPERALVLTRKGRDGLSGAVEEGGRRTAVELGRKREALVIHGTYEPGMKTYADQCAAYYEAKGYEVRSLPGDWATVVETLATAPESGHIYGRMVVVSHGGWDGPMFDDWLVQLSDKMNAESFADLVRAIRRGTTLDAKLIFSACHSGGSNRYETEEDTYRYSDALASKTGRMAYGVDGSTSTEWSRELCRFAEGEGPARQESRVSGPDGGTTVKRGARVRPGSSIADRPLGQE